MRFEYVNENSLLLRISDEIDLRHTGPISLLTRKLKQEFRERLVDITPSYTTILVEYTGPESVSEEIISFATTHLDTCGQSPISTAGQTVMLPTYYHPEVGPDLEHLAETRSLSVDEVIEIHSGREYIVCAIGFAPGFGFLAEVDDRIQVPRKDTPRKLVAAGSVGIAAKQTAVYPADSPGGWQIIGNCPTPLFNPHKRSDLPFAVGDTIRFEPISRNAFLKQGGKVQTC